LYTIFDHITNAAYGLNDFIVPGITEFTAQIFNMNIYEIRHVWGDAFDPFTMSNFIDVHIKNLRRKLGDAGNDKIIQTVRSVGYMIEDGEQ